MVPERADPLKTGYFSVPEIDFPTRCLLDMFTTLLIVAFDPKLWLNSSTCLINQVHFGQRKRIT